MAADHRRPHRGRDGPLRLEILADGVPAGDALLVDEVVVRLG
jgi:hypothetical protein